MFDDTALIIKGKELSNGIDINVEETSFKIEFDGDIWKNTPSSIRQILLDNLVYGNTNFLPLLSKKGSISYNINYPLFESQLYKNQLFDMVYCEQIDNVPVTTYVRQFHNLEFIFENRTPLFPDLNDFKLLKKTTKNKHAIIPFSFGKESLLTFALCRELGIEPILVYVQEPVQKYEEEKKLLLIPQFEKEFKTKIHFVKNGPGLFRQNGALSASQSTELGWGSQTTLIALLMIPYVYKYKADYVLFGSEFSNNFVEMYDGWKSFCSYDQSSFWTPQQHAMISILTGNSCGVYSMLESLEEISIFYMLHTYYSDLAKYQFSCFANDPPIDGSNWCHNCSKCDKNYLFCLSCGIDTKKVGFTRNLLNDDIRFVDYFKHISTFDYDIDMAMYIVNKKNIKGSVINTFQKIIKSGNVISYATHYKHYTQLHSNTNVIPEQKEKLQSMFQKVISEFKQSIPKP
ncbi:MAG: hypothetical protein WCO06_04700 [Candidatus Roizmanbacteria bacterium]